MSKVEKSTPVNFGTDDFDGRDLFRSDGYHYCRVSSIEAAKEIRKAVNEHAALEAVAEAAMGLLDALSVAEKQWRGLNMLNKGEQRAYEITLQAKVSMEKALAALRNGGGE